MSNHRARVYAYTKQDRLIIESCEVASVWTASPDVSNIATSINHREGSVAMSFDKDGVTETFGQISKTVDTDNPINLVDYRRGKLRFWINLSDLTNVASVSLYIGESASHNYVYTIADTALTTGWNEVTFNVDSPTATTGNGAAWSSVDYIAIRVNLDLAANTLTAILVDAITAVYEAGVNIESVNITGTGLATAAKQDIGNTSLSTIAGDTTSIDSKLAILGQKNSAGSMPVVLANDDNVEIQGDVASGDPDSGNPVKVGGKYNLVAPTFTDGDRADFQSDVNGNLNQNVNTLLAGENQADNVQEVSIKLLTNSTDATAIDQSSTLEASSVAKGSSGKFFGIEGRIDSTAPTLTYYVQFLNYTSVPADGVVNHLKTPYKVQHTNGTDSKFTLDCSFPNGIYASTGIVIVVSTAEFIKTISGAYYSGTAYYI